MKTPMKLVSQNTCLNRKPRQVGAPCRLLSINALAMFTVTLLLTGCEGDLDRFLSLINSTSVIAGSDGAFVFAQSEAGQCPTPNGGLLGASMQPALCDSLDPNRESTSSLMRLAPATLTATELEISLVPFDASASDGERLVWIGADGQSIEAYDIESGMTTTYMLDDDRLGGTTTAFVVAVKGDYVAFTIFGDDVDGSRILVYSFDADAIVREVESFLSPAALEGDWLIYQTAGVNDDDEIGNDYRDVRVVNVLTGESAVLAAFVDENTLGRTFWGHGGRVFWTTGSREYVLHGYNLAASFEDFERRWDYTGSSIIDPLLVTDLGAGGILLAQHSSSNSDVVGYRLVPWDDGDTTTLFEFDSSTDAGPWYRNNDLRFGGTNYIIWTDPQTGEFVVYDRATGESGRFDPIDREL